MTNLKHEGFIMSVLAKMHESWMSEEDKETYDTLMLNLVGREMDKAIEEGLELGYSLEKQLDSVEFALRNIK
jgi:DNA-binding transcriptional regulator YhcF (GntR family)